jgi:hypothetical protein
MTDAFYTDLRDKTALPMITQFGFPMTVKSNREPIIDPNTGAISVEAVPVSTAVTGIMRFYSQKEIDGKDILTEDRQALIEATTLNTAGVVPDSSMQLIANGVTYNIVRNTPTQPGGISLMYRLQIRK